MKPTFYISAPFDTYSGYGARSRDIAKALIDSNKYDVKLLPQRWGDTPWGFIENNPEWEFLKNHFISLPLSKQPDIWSQITVPNEFQRVGKYNIGITAGIESTICPAEWVEGCNRMDLNLISSEHSKNVFLNTKFEKRDQNNNLVSEGKIEKPIEVLFEGANLDQYFPISSQEISKLSASNSMIKSLDSISESFAYLFVGHWLPGDLGEDRKNVGLLIKAFLETFKNKKKKPALVLKVSAGSSSYMDRTELLKRIEKIKSSLNSSDIPNIYLLHGELSNSEMNLLYNHPKVKAMINLTKGEGFGRPLLEFSLCQKPIIVSGWSGHMDFIRPDYTLCLNGELKNVHPSAANNMLLKESQWFNPDHGSIASSLVDVFENTKRYVDGAKRQAYYSKTNFSLENMSQKLDELLTNYIPEFPEEVSLKLPQISSIKLPKKPK